MEIKVSEEPQYKKISFHGYIDFETTNKYESSIRDFVVSNEGKGLIFDLEYLNFVGSSGVSTFIKMLAALNHVQPRPKYLNVSGDFLRLFKAFQGTIPFEFVTSIEQALNPETVV